MSLCTNFIVSVSRISIVKQCQSLLSLLFWFPKLITLGYNTTISESSYYEIVQYVLFGIDTNFEGGKRGNFLMFALF